MTTKTKNLTTTAAHEHNEGVVYILRRVSRQGASAEQVIRAGVELAVDRGLEPRHRDDFRRWVAHCVAQARSGGATEGLKGSDDLKDLLLSYQAAARAAGVNGTGDAGLDRLDAVAAASLAGDELALAQLVSGVARGSVELWTGNGDDAPSGLRTRDLDTGEIVESDVVGAIGSAAGAALATWWTGPLSWGGALAGAGIGGAISSALEYVQQDRARDEILDDEDSEGNPVPGPDPSGGGEEGPDDTRS